MFFALADTELLRALRLTSPTPFEVEDIVFLADSKVPEPAGWTLLPAGCAPVGSIARSHRGAARATTDLKIGYDI